MNNTSLEVKGLVGLSGTAANVVWDFHTGQRRTVVLEMNTRSPLYIVSTEQGFEFKRNGMVAVLQMAELLKLIDQLAPELKNGNLMDTSSYNVT